MESINFSSIQKICLILLVLLLPGKGFRVFPQVFPEERTGIKWLYITGPESGYDKGDDDHFQEIYLMVDKEAEGNFQVKIEGITDSDIKAFGDALFQLRIFGNKNVYMEFPDRRNSDVPPLFQSDIGYEKGQILLSDPVKISSGEYYPELESWLFRIEFEGMNGELSFHYKYHFKFSDPRVNEQRMMSVYYNNLSFLIGDSTVCIPVYIPAHAAGITLNFFDMDQQGVIWINSNRRINQKIVPPGDSEYRFTMLNVFSDERNDSIYITIKGNTIKNNNISLGWLIEDNEGRNITYPFKPQSIKATRRKYRF